MPDGPNNPPDAIPDRRAARSSVVELPGYVELHCRSNFSFLEGASHPHELVEQAAALGHSAIAITDRNSLAGMVRAHVAAKEHRLKLLIGTEVTPLDAPPIVLWAMNRAGYGRLCRLITRGRRNAPKGECRLSLRDVLEHADGLIAGLVLTAVHQPVDVTASKLREAFGDRAYLIAELHQGPHDSTLLAEWNAASARFDMPLVAANDVHYHSPERQSLQDVLTAIRHGCTVAELGERRFTNAERHLKSGAEMAALFKSNPAAVHRTVEIADRCQFSLDELKYEYPEELSPPGLTPMQHLNNQTWDGAHKRYPGGIPEKIRDTIEHELQLIEELQYAAYFLTVWDLVRYARSKNILCQGRGSAANSAVCYCLGVTSVDPTEIDLLFERFISRERGEAPDIDVDFEHERREEVIQYLYTKYGRERAAMTAEVISYRPRSALREVGKALGLSSDRIDLLARQVEHSFQGATVESRFQEAGLPHESKLAQRLMGFVETLIGFPRHLSQHVGGMVLTNGPLCELAPIENASMADRTIIEWNKDDLEALGILKVDCLALGMLTAIRKCFELIDRHYGRRMTLANVPADDQQVYHMICRADTIGVFQIESRAQMSMLPRLKPREFYDLVIEVAIVRPGPIQGDMVHPYLRRRSKEEEYDPEKDEGVISRILGKTFGVPIFQEQAMRLAIEAAGFTPGEADQLRRAMGAWGKKGVIDRFQEKLINGLTANGYSGDFAKRLFKQIQGFGDYGFPESHAASFALLAYVSAWLKFHYPAAFTAALLNSQPMGFYAPAQLVKDVIQHGVTVLPVDVNASEWNCTLEQATGRKREWALRLGFRLLKGCSEKIGNDIVRKRGDQHFRSVEDFARRTGASAAMLNCLSEADAFASCGINRREALWDALPDYSPAPLFDAQTNDSEQSVALPELDAFDNVIADYRALKLSLNGHPIQFIRPQLEASGVTAAIRLSSINDGRPVRVAGLVLMRQRPSTAKNITFVTLEDETGVVNLIVRFDIWTRYRRAAREATVLLAGGILQRQNSVTHVLVDQLEDISDRLSSVKTKSRDFH